MMGAVAAAVVAGAGAKVGALAAEAEGVEE